MTEYPRLGVAEVERAVVMGVVAVRRTGLPQGQSGIGSGYQESKRNEPETVWHGAVAYDVCNTVQAPNRARALYNVAHNGLIR
jgi:hypothetical protein